jgi:hypothetical protein
LRRFGILLAYLAAAVAVAGVFGIVHDQISYSVSSEYFTKFKFRQFRLLDASVPERLRAAEVGFLASWWMGVPLGLLTGVAGFIHPTAKQMRKALFLSLLLIAGFTLMFALAGLVYGFMKTQTFALSNYAGWFVPKGLEQPRRFICAGYMHNAAYLGAVAAVPAAWLFHLGYRRCCACGLTLRCTRRPTAGFARFRPRVNSNVRRHSPMATVLNVVFIVVFCVALVVAPIAWLRMLTAKTQRAYLQSVALFTVPIIGALGLGYATGFLDFGAPTSPQFPAEFVPQALSWAQVALLTLAGCIWLVGVNMLMYKHTRRMGRSFFSILNPFKPQFRDFSGQEWSALFVLAATALTFGWLAISQGSVQ